MSRPATAESGFIFSMPSRQHPLASDIYYQRVIQWYLPQDIYKAVYPDIERIADESVSENVLNWMCNAESQQPYLKKHNVWGQRHDVDKLVTSEGWKALRSWGLQNGIVATGYEDQYGHYKRIVQHAKNYFFTSSSALTGCPLSMTDGAAKLLSKLLPSYPPSHPFHEAYNRLISRENAWTSGQWMTERPGGSDVQSTETWATFSPLPNKTGEFGRLDQGDYLVSGFKFFSSATDADVTVLLAKTESGKLSAFLAPLTKTIIDEDGNEKTVTNGVRIHRLKQKLGTKQLPTAELELVQTRAHLVGPLDKGVKTISDILNITRAHALMGSTAGWRRCMSVAKSFAKSRVTWGVPLWVLPLHLRTLAEMELKIRASTQLAFFTIALMSFSENGFPTAVDASYVPLPHPGAEATVVLRTMTAIGKAVVSKNAAAGVQECMESLGGVGYMDEADEPENLARAFRDANVNTIWEGTTNVLSSELVRNMQRNNHLELYAAWMERAIAAVKDTEQRNVLTTAWNSVKSRLQGNPYDALGDGRRIMFSAAWVVKGLLLAVDAQRDQDPVAVEVAQRWILDGEGGVGVWVLPGVGDGAKRRPEDGESRGKWDCRIVWNEELPDIRAAGVQALTKSKM